MAEVGNWASRPSHKDGSAAQYGLILPAITSANTYYMLLID